MKEATDAVPAPSPTAPDVVRLIIASEADITLTPDEPITSEAEMTFSFDWNATPAATTAQVTQRTATSDASLSYDAVTIPANTADAVKSASMYKHPDRPLQLRVSTESTDSRYIIRVADNGIGIKKEDLKKLLGDCKKYKGANGILLPDNFYLLLCA